MVHAIAELLYGDRDGLFQFEKQAKITTKTADGVVSRRRCMSLRGCQLNCICLSRAAPPVTNKL